MRLGTLGIPEPFKGICQGTAAFTVEPRACLPFLLCWYLYSWYRNSGGYSIWPLGTGQEASRSSSLTCSFSLTGGTKQHPPQRTQPESSVEGTHTLTIACGEVGNRRKAVGPRSTMWWSLQTPVPWFKLRAGLVAFFREASVLFERTSG